MRALFLLLLAANLGVLAYFQLRAAGPEAAPAQPPLNAERIKLVSVGSGPAPEAKPRPAAPRTTACLEWGSFTAAELARAEAALAEFNLGERVRQRALEERVVAHWIHIPPLKSRQDAERKISELKARGITEYFLVQEAGKWKNAVSLGFFKTEEGAKRRLAELQDQGVRSAVIAERSDLMKLSVLVLREPGDAVAARLVELKQEFPGTELKATRCEV